MRASRLLPTLLALVAVPSMLPPAAAGEPPSDQRAVAPEWNLRLRHEHVDDEAFGPSADATTLRLRAGVRLRPGRGFTALVEGEGTANAGNDYNSGANGRTAWPAITDPEGAELNQAWIDWRGARANATLGRQRLLFGNQRWIGNSGWRQNEQTFDALALGADLPHGLAMRYGWLDRVHRVASDKAVDPLARERDLDSHAFELAWKRGVQQVVGYALLHDDQDAAAASTSTYGLRAVTDAVRDGRGWGLAVEIAEQRDHADNPLSFSHRYWLVEPSMTRAGIAMRAGWEHLGGDGRHALQTPLASLHPFNGWADKFNTTPPGGLDDRYVSAGGKWHGRFDWVLAWHDYRADTGGDYGQEWNASFGFPVHGPVKGLVKLADYRADGFARDTTKAWVQLEWAH